MLMPCSGDTGAVPTAALLVLEWSWTGLGLVLNGLDS